jgi:D-alanyl-D-alanine carboxypeptidase
MPVSRPFTAALIAVLTLASPSHAAPAKPSATMTLRQCITQEAKKNNFSGVISIARPGGALTFAQGAMAGPGSAKMRADAQFNIGSAGKMWTAVAVAQLVDAKRISLHDPIGRHVSDLTPEAAAVTVRQLLTHSGGLGNFFTPDNMDLFKRATSLTELKPLVASAKPAFAPGSRSEYSNSGFLLLGIMVEAISGKSFGDYLQQSIFSPARMTRSGMLPGSPKSRAIGMTNFPEMMEEPAAPQGPPPPRAQPGPPPPQGPNGPMLPPPGPLRPAAEAALMGTSAGGGFSTPSDMQRFFAALLGAKLTSPEMRDMLTSRQIEVLPAKGPLPAIYYGLGFMVADYKGHGWTGHNGGLPGGNVATAAFAKDQTAAIVMTNRDPPGADLMMRKIQGMLFDDARCRG